MITFEGYRIPDGFARSSDGCTWGPDKLFGIQMKPACIYHDFLRRYGIVGVKEADRLFHRFLIHLGVHRAIARFYWFVVKITRWYFKKVQPLPREWEGYRHRHTEDIEKPWLGIG